MAFDGVLINCIKQELKDKILEGRIDKVRQPERDEIHIGIRVKGKNQLLLLSASSNFPRVHLTKLSKPNPLTPPLFCMVLRKHILGGRIISIEQPDFDRILILSIESRNELGDVSVKRIYIEIMGRHSNIILVDSNNIIIDSAKRITEEISRVRQVMPGIAYNLPPSQNKKNPLLQTEESLNKLLMMDDLKNPEEIARWVFKGFTGISKVTAREIAYPVKTNIKVDHLDTGLSCKDRNKDLVSSFIGFFNRVKAKDFKPALLKDKSNRPEDIFPFRYEQFDEGLMEEFDSISLALDAYYDTRDRMDRIKQRTAHLTKVITTNLERACKKSDILTKEYQEALAKDDYKLYGELITANIHMISKGTSEVHLINYYDPQGKTVNISLDPRKSPSQNAQMYYKKYRKAENALIMIKRQLKDTKIEIKYLESQLNNLENSENESDIQDIRQELIDEGYIKRPKRGKSKQSLSSKPHLYLSSHGFHIYVGKNNRQNDRLTLKMAGPLDIWLHTKDIAGSHVIIETKGKEVPEQTLLEGGMLGAFYSRARDSSNVPVDYCLRKNVRKPRGAKPGMVIYDNHKTLYVTPREDKIKALKKIQ